MYKLNRVGRVCMPVWKINPCWKSLHAAMKKYRVMKHKHIRCVFSIVLLLISSPFVPSVASRAWFPFPAKYTFWNCVKFVIFITWKEFVCRYEKVSGNETQTHTVCIQYGTPHQQPFCPFSRVSGSVPFSCTISILKLCEIIHFHNAIYSFILFWKYEMKDS